MKLKFLFTTLSFICMAATSFAQDSLIISAPVDISKEGWNKVLQLENGNTVLFHFELKKGIVVKVFNKEGAEIASKKHLCNVIDINLLDDAVFEGLHAINNEAVLFVTQQVDNVRTLVRLRFDGTTAGLIKEERIVKSASFQKQTDAYVLKRRNADGYAVFCYTSLPTDTATSVKMIKYNNKHEVVKEIPFEIPTRAYDNVNLLNTGIDEDGDMLVSLQASKIIQYPDLYERSLLLLYMPEGEDRFMYRVMKLPSAMQLKDASFSINPFASTINMFITKAWQIEVQDGFGRRKADILSRAIFIMPKDISDLKETKLENEKANNSLRVAMKDTTIKYQGAILNTFTDGRGVTTVVYEDRLIPLKASNNVLGYAGDVCITQYDDNGTELWGVVLPRAGYYAPWGTHPRVFKTNSESEMHRPAYFTNKKSHYVLYNDADSNFSKVLGDKIGGVYNYQPTNTVYHYINKRNVITKRYLYGTPVAGENRYIYPKSADYSIQNNVVASLMCNRKGKEETFHIAWCKLPN